MSVEHYDHLVNPSLIDAARHALRDAWQKQAFVPGAPQGGDPSGGGGAPPPGGPPPGGPPPGGPPPGGPPPDMGGGPPPLGAPPPGNDGVMDKLLMEISQLRQSMQAGGGGAAGAGGAGGMLKPKIDVNIEIAEIKNMLARMSDFMGVPVKAQDFSTSPDQLNQMAANPGQPPNIDTSAPGGGAPGAEGAAIGPMPPMQGAGVPGMPPKAGTYREPGRPFVSNRLKQTSDNASAVLAVMRRERSMH